MDILLTERKRRQDDLARKRATERTIWAVDTVDDGTDSDGGGYANNGFMSGGGDNNDGFMLEVDNNNGIMSGGRDRCMSGGDDNDRIILGGGDNTDGIMSETDNTEVIMLGGEDTGDGIMYVADDNDEIMSVGGEEHRDDRVPTLPALNLRHDC